MIRAACLASVVLISLIDPARAQLSRLSAGPETLLSLSNATSPAPGPAHSDVSARSDGSLLDLEPQTAQKYPSVASDGRDFLVLWLEGKRLYSTETGDRSRRATPQVYLGEVSGVSSVAVGGSGGYLTAWLSRAEAAYRIEGRIFVPSDSGRSMAPFAVPDALYVPFGLSAAAAPGMYLLSWSTGSGSEAVRLTADGRLLDPSPFVLFDDTRTSETPSIAFDGVDFVVARASHDESSGSGYSVKTARVSLEGSVRFDRHWLNGSEGSARAPALACADGICLLVWRVESPEPAETRRLVGQRFRSGGALIDPLPFDLDVARRDQTLPAVAWDGQRFVVTWRDQTGLLRPPERVLVRLVPANGPVESGPPDLVVERDVAAPFPAAACNTRGRCMLVAPGPVLDRTSGPTLRLYKRFFGETGHGVVRR